jgi:predicted house-cleaning noncanonical NTP pyrophosphatase (MazG superfamily)
MQYNKLVRDKIPAIIMENDGKEARTRTLSGSQLEAALLEKLEEELAEYKRDKSEEEMADMLEVLYALAGNSDAAWRSVEQKRLQKRAERGGFEQGIFLEGI